jgi:hypothetical protein
LTYVGADGGPAALVVLLIVHVDHHPAGRVLVLQSQFAALLLVVGASSGGLMASAPERPAQRARRIDRWAPDQAGQQPAQLGDSE